LTKFTPSSTGSITKQLTTLNKNDMAKATGLGGVFIKFKDPTAMNNWYQEILSLNPNDYGILFEFNHSIQAKAYLQLGTFAKDSDYFRKEKQQVMLNFRVDNLEELIEHLKVKKVSILNEMEEYEYGKFLHIEDPEGNTIELWEPVDKEFETSDDPKNKMS
jgi:predicted enzyme related to lactoylglutathione lyase